MQIFKAAPKWKEPKCPSPVEWIKKLWLIHTMGYDPAIKQNSISMWLNLSGLP